MIEFKSPNYPVFNMSSWRRVRTYPNQLATRIPPIVDHDTYNDNTMRPKSPPTVPPPPIITPATDQLPPSIILSQDQLPPTIILPQDQLATPQDQLATPTVRTRMYNPDKVTNYTLADKYIIIGLSHENSRTGAPIALENYLAFFRKHGYQTALTYASGGEELIKYIQSTVSTTGLRPIVFCNTIVMKPYVKFLYNKHIPTFWIIHEWIDSHSGISMNSFLKEPHVYTQPINMVFVCQKSKENFMKKLPFLDDALVVYNGFNTLSYMNRLQGPCLITKDDSIIISMIGTIDKRKNQQAFIDNVYYKCKERYRNIKLVLVGKYHIGLHLNNYDDSIIIIGEVENALPYINNSDIIVSYSLNEVMPLNLLEAMFCKKPIVTSNVGGVSDIVENGVNGYLFPPNDHAACLDGLCNLIESPELRESFGAAGECIFYEKFDENVAFAPLLHFPHMVDQQT
jgi:glycosyltransferase involved in cell wall biosynthesis